jgi:hypothetical protein
MLFFNPPPIMTLVEIILALRTTDETCAKVVALTEDIGKKARASKNFYGLMVNRVPIPMINDAINRVYECLASQDDAMMRWGRGVSSASTSCSTSWRRLQRLRRLEVPSEQIGNRRLLKHRCRPARDEAFLVGGDDPDGDRCVVGAD